MAEYKLYNNPNNKINALKLVNEEQALVLKMQAEYAASAFDTQAGTYEEMRAAYNEERKMWNTGGPELKVIQDVFVPFGDGKIKTRINKLENDENAPMVFYIHGGGFVVGSIDTHGLIQRKLAAYSGCAVIGIDYTLTPESVYPQGIEECASVVKYYIEHAKEYGLDADRIAFAGDSGGANMSMGTTMMLRDEGFDMSKIKAEILFYGAYGLKQSRSMFLHGGMWDGLTEADIAFYFGMYLGNHDEKDAPYYNIYANDLSHDVPPCYIVAAELDPLRDDSELLYEILKDKGIEAEYHEYPGVLHAFVVYSNYIKAAEDAIVNGAEFLKKHF